MQIDTTPKCNPLCPCCGANMDATETIETEEISITNNSKEKEKEHEEALESMRCS